MKGKKVIVRCDRSGVFFGTLKEKEGHNVTLTNARKLFYWTGACAVEQLSVDGTSNPNDCKFTVWVDEISVSDEVQTIPCTDKAIQSIENVKIWKI